MVALWAALLLGCLLVAGASSPPPLSRPVARGECEEDSGRAGEAIVGTAMLQHKSKTSKGSHNQSLTFVNNACPPMDDWTHMNSWYSGRKAVDGDCKYLCNQRDNCYQYHFSSDNEGTCKTYNCMQIRPLMEHNKCLKGGAHYVAHCSDTDQKQAIMLVPIGDNFFYMLSGHGDWLSAFVGGHAVTWTDRMDKAHGLWKFKMDNMQIQSQWGAKQCLTLSGSQLIIRTCSNNDHHQMWFLPTP